MAELKEVATKPTLSRERIGLFQHMANSHLAHIPRNHTLDDILLPGYWSSVSATLRDNDNIKAVCEDGSWVADLHVRSSAITAASVVCMNYKECNAIVRESRFDNYVLKWGGPTNKWQIIDEDTNPPTVIQKGIDDKERAVKDLLEYQKKLIA